MSEIKGQMGELRATIHITRAATGKVETYELVGHVEPEMPCDPPEPLCETTAMQWPLPKGEK
jgi:hypothetical protein